MDAKYLHIAVVFLIQAMGIEAQESKYTTNADGIRHEWSASWICHPSASETGYGVFHFRKQVSLPEEPDSFIVHVSGDNRYVLYVNGHRTCSGPAAGDPFHWTYETIDIGRHLHAGENIIAAMVVNFGELRPLAQMSVGTGFILQADDESLTRINTDDSWKVAGNKGYHPIPVSDRMVQGYFAAGVCDRVDYSLFPSGWEELHFDDSGWDQAQEKGKGVGRGYLWGSSRYLVPRAIPLMEEKVERFTRIARSSGADSPGHLILPGNTLRIPANTSASFLIDQTYLTKGYPELLFSKGKGSRIKITYAESLFNGDDKKGDRDEIGDKEIKGYHDLILPDGKDHRFFRPLWLRTYRYIQVDIKTSEDPLFVDDFYGVYTAYPFELKASFESDDEVLGDIWEAGWRTARLCSGETYFDCPYYEQLQYLETRVHSFVTLYLAGDDRLMRNAIRQFDRSRNYEGLTMSRYPSHVPQYIPVYSLYWITMLHDYWMLREDDRFLRQFMPGVKAIVSWFENRIDSTGMLGGLPWWNFLDWSTEFTHGIPDGAETGHSSLLSLHFIYALQHASDLLDHFGDDYHAAEYRHLSKSIIQAVRDHCFDRGRSLYADTPEKSSFSQHTNIMAVLAGMVHEADQQVIMQKVMEEQDLIRCTLSYKFNLFLALKKAGMADMYAELLAPWKDMLMAGLTTFAEWDVELEPRSDCHLWSSSPCYDFLATICGIMPSEPGFRAVRIEPAFGHLESIKGSMPHPRGNISVDLEKTGKGGIRGYVILPGQLSGTFIWKGKEIAITHGKTEIEF
jgi:alpha-L-rhamnosidase